MAERPNRRNLHSIFNFVSYVFAGLIIFTVTRFVLQLFEIAGWQAVLVSLLVMLAGLELISKSNYFV